MSSPENTTESDPAADMFAEQSVTRIRLWDRIRLLGWGRSMIVAAGALAFLLGVLTAWRAEESTTLLIVGAMLLVVGFVVLAPEVREIHLSYGEGRASILRTVGGALQRVAESESAEQLRNQVAELSAQVEQAAAAAEQAGKEATTRDRSEQRRRELARRLMQRSPLPSIEIPPKAFHSFERGSVILTLRLTNARDPVTCFVTDPEGGRWTKSLEPPLLELSPWTFLVVYPNEFVGSAALTPGNYAVEWRRGSTSTPFLGLTPLTASLLGHTFLPLLAQDAFAIRATDGQQEPPREPKGSGQ